MRWILILMIAVAGCRRKPGLPEASPAPQEEAAPAAPAPAPRGPASAPPAASAPRQIPTRAGHPGEPFNPAELRGLPEKYFDQVGSFPSSWQQMIDRKYLRTVPLGKNGKPLDFLQYTEWSSLGPKSP